MKRLAVLLMGLSLTLALSSCALFEKKKMTSDTETDQMEDISPSEGDLDAPQPGSDVQTITPDDPAGGYGTPPTTHVVQKGDTLYKLARQYYNNQSMWKKIWEANRDVVPNPNQLNVGTTLQIP